MRPASRAPEDDRGVGDSSTTKSWRRELLWALLPVLLLAPPLAWSGRRFADDLLREERALLQHEVDWRANAVERAFSRIQGRLQSFAAYVDVQKVDVGAIDYGRLDAFARGLHASAEWIRAFQVVSNGVVVHTYPLEGNESVLGYNLLADPRPVIGGDVLRAERTGRVTITGPLDLVQGGLGLIVRQPLPRETGAPSLLVAVVLNTAPLLAEAGLGETDQGDVLVAIRQSGGRVFFGPESVFDANSLIQRIQLPDGAWEMAAIPGASWGHSRKGPVLLFHAAGATIVLLVSLLVFVLARRQTDLAETVGRQTIALQRELAARRESELRLRSMGDNLPESYVYQYMHDEDGRPRFLYVSAGVERIHGVTEGEVLRDAEVLHGQTDSSHRAELARVEAASISGMTDFEIELPMHRKDGMVRWMHLRSRPRRGEDGRVVWDGVATDITRRKQAELELERLNRALRAIRDCNHAIVHASDENLLLHEICRIVVDVGGYRMAWVGIAGRDAEKTVRPVAQFGFADGYLDDAQISWADNERGRGPTGVALRTGRVSLVRDIPTDPRLALWRDEAVRRGYVSSIAFPLRFGDETAGALSIYASHADAFDPAECSLLGELADDVSFGVAALRARAARERAEAALRDEHSRSESIIEFLPDATFVIDQNKRVVAWNRACEAMTGVRKHDVLGQGDYVYALPFFGERRPILIDLIDVPSTHLEAGYNYVKREGETIVAEAYLPRLRGGRGAHLWGAAAPLYDAAGKRCGAVEVIRDVTAMKDVEQALGERERHLSLILNNVSDVIFAVEVRGDEFRFISANRRFLEATGLTEQQVKGLPVREVIPPASHELVFGKYREAIRSRRPVRWEETSDYPAGRRVGVVTIAPVFDSHDRCVELIGMVHDITDRKRDEETLHALVAQMERIREEERTRIAREVHDVLGQLLTGLNMDLAWCGRKVPAIADDALRQQFSKKHEDMSALVVAMIETVQKIATELRPGVLDNLGLPAAIRFEAGRFSARSGILCEVAPMDDQCDLAPESATGVFRIFQELLTNIARHAGATRARIRLEQTRDHLHLQVHDNGRGIRNEELDGAGSLGILGMRERAARLGGALVLRGSPGEGTIAELTIPLRKVHA